MKIISFFGFRFAFIARILYRKSFCRNRRSQLNPICPTFQSTTNEVELIENAVVFAFIAIISGWQITNLIIIIAVLRSMGYFEHAQISVLISCLLSLISWLLSVIGKHLSTFLQRSIESLDLEKQIHITAGRKKSTLQK